MINDMTPREFVDRRAGGREMTLLDVREDWETTLAPVPTDILHIPMGQIADRLTELDPELPTVVVAVGTPAEQDTLMVTELAAELKADQRGGFGGGVCARVAWGQDDAVAALAAGARHLGAQTCERDRDLVELATIA